MNAKNFGGTKDGSSAHPDGDPRANPEYLN